jgi:protein O-mannosyl-transferase
MKAPASRRKLPSVALLPTFFELRIRPLYFHIIATFLLFIGVVVTYGHTLNYSFHLDDQVGIIQNQNVRLEKLTLDNIKHIFYGNRPISNLTFLLNYFFGGIRVRGYHLVNISIHFLNSFLIYIIFFKTLSLLEFQEDKLKKKESKGSIALLGALIWSIHPVNTQAVTYIIQRMASLAAFFYLLSLLTYILGRQNKRGTALFYFCLSGLSALMAFGTKENTLMLPIVILLYDYFFLSRFHFSYSLKKIIGVGIVAGVLVLGVFWIMRTYQGPTLGLSFIFSGQYGAGDLDPVLRTMTEWRVIVLYMSLLFFPFPGRLNLDYDMTLSSSLFDPFSTFLSLLFLLLILGFACWNVKKHPLLSFAIFWFFINLAIESTFLKLDLVYEHRCYVPSIMLFLPVSKLIFSLEELFAGRFRQIIPVVGVVLVGALVYSTYVRNKVWESEISLWNDVVLKSPFKERDRVYLGVVYLENGKTELAIKNFQAALVLNPKDPVAHYNLGNAYQSSRNISDALQEFKEAILLKPDYPEAHFNLANAYFLSNQNDFAIAEFKMFINLNYNLNYFNSQAHTYLGILYMKKGNVSEARKEFEEAVILDPRTSFSHYYYALFLEVTGRKDDAKIHYQESLKWAEEQGGSVSPAIIRQRIDNLK